MSNVASLDDYLTQDHGSFFITGAQSVYVGTRLILAADKASNLNTRARVSGYPGSPWAAVISIGYDQKVKKLLAAQGIDFFPAINEGSSVNAAYGSQRVNTRREDKVDGVASVLAFKGPGLAQAWDYTNVGSNNGAHRLGGVTLLVGDDTAGASTATWVDSKAVLQANGISVLAPSFVHEIPEFVFMSNRLSRHSGTWTAIPLTSELAESSGIIDFDKLRNLRVTMPDPREMPGRLRGLNLNYDPAYNRHIRGAEEEFRALAAEDFVDANFFNHVPKGWEGGSKPRLGIAAPGVSYSHVRSALEALGIDEEKAARLGIRLLKLGAPTLIGLNTVSHFAKGLEQVLIAEELHNNTERNVKVRIQEAGIPVPVLGRRDKNGRPLLPAKAHDVAIVAGALARVIDDPEVKERAAQIDRHLRDVGEKPIVVRPPYFCSGCPHSQGTKVVFGEVTIGGNGCFTLVASGFLPPELTRSEDYSCMGGEDTWLGEAPYSSKRHATQLIGDGTGFHSAFKAISAAVAAYEMEDFVDGHGAPAGMTFKLLNNMYTAMTGGQPILAGHTNSNTQWGTVQIAAEMNVKRVKEIVIVTDGDAAHRRSLRRELSEALPKRAKVKVVGDDQLIAESVRLKDVAGVTTIIHESECATEIRRRRNRGKEKVPDTRVFVNEEACENCGDCDIKSGGCGAVQTVPTPLGPKTRIDNEGSCSADYSCVGGFCPALNFVQGSLRIFDPAKIVEDSGIKLNGLVAPTPAVINESHGILTPGMGGFGATTVGRIIGQAVDIENRLNPDRPRLGYIGYDNTGLSQKQGPVTAHSRIIAPGSQIRHTSRIHMANVVLACDAVNASSNVEGNNNLAKIGPNTVVVVNTKQEQVISAKYDPSARFRNEEVLDSIRKRTTEGNFHAFNASAVSVALTGTILSANTVMLGYAFQKGLIPLSAESIMDAIILNGTAVKNNLAAFEWGRRCADQPAIAEAIEKTVYPPRELPKTLQDKIDVFAKRLEEFQDAAYALTYRNRIEQVLRKDIELGNDTEESRSLTAAAAHSLFKVMYYKDEYEVGRLYASEEWQKALNHQFGEGRIVTHMLAPPILGSEKKRRIPEAVRISGVGTLPVGKLAFGTLASAKTVRGTPFDIFRGTPERKRHVQARQTYESFLDSILDSKNTQVTCENYTDIVKRAIIPYEHWRGFGSVLQKHMDEHPLEPIYKGSKQPVAPARELVPA